MKHIWKIEEERFLIDNYPTRGIIYCMNKLNLSKIQIRNKIRILKLKLIDKIDVEPFRSISSNKISYIMGLLWADGSISNESEKSYFIRLEANIDDMNSIEEIIYETGNWKKYIRQRTRKGNKCKKSITYHIGFKKLYDIFKNYDFHSKSRVSPFKILNTIPNDLKHYFFRGIVDGDGCFYINKKEGNYQLSISSSYEQDWSYLIELCKKLQINRYGINLTENKKKKSKSSQFRITNKKDIIKIGNYIYNNFSDDKIGFDRKYRKFELML